MQAIPRETSIMHLCAPVVCMVRHSRTDRRQFLFLFIPVPEFDCRSLAVTLNTSAFLPDLFNFSCQLSAFPPFLMPLSLFQLNAIVPSAFKSISVLFTVYWTARCNLYVLNLWVLIIFSCGYGNWSALYKGDFSQLIICAGYSCKMAHNCDLDVLSFGMSGGKGIQENTGCVTARKTI